MAQIRGRGMHGGKITGDTLKVLKRLLKALWAEYRLPLVVVFICIIFTSVSQTTGSIFLAQIVDQVITPGAVHGWAYVERTLYVLIGIMGGMYLIGILSSFIYTRLMAIITQGFLNKIRKKTFHKMESLPIKYFDTNTHGDIMSIYTNDIDAIRQLVSQSIPSLISNFVLLVSCIIIMFTYSIWLALIIFVGVFVMMIVVKKFGNKSAKYFVKQQRSIGKTEGFIEEMMHGQKVIKVFTHEEKAMENFDALNQELYQNAVAANKFGNLLGPVMMNIGNFVYVLVAVAGIIIFSLGWKNLTIANIFTPMTTISIGVVISFLNLARQFTQHINQTAQQINSVVMGIAGAGRVFDLLDQEKEVDNGYVTLVNAIINKDGTITESEERTGVWAWKHPHQDGTITYKKLEGDIVLEEVDFGYNPETIVLHDVSLYARPGQKVAFVGATGAGKTTITNLINRFYDIADGKVRYDGINITKIKKDDLRRSIGMVLQDTNLFTGTVMENIRYGKLDATDEDVYKAAKIANAYDFITRLPEGFNTMLESDGANLSQGQRQLISIARASVADTPVMILDEATSSIDTRTEILVQKGTDKLMEGRTVFVIAHRLSTVQNSDVIMVLEHGRIIERGSHDQLIEEKGTYYQLYTGAFELE